MGTDELELAGDFTPYRPMLFTTIGSLLNGVEAFFPTDLAKFSDLGQDAQAELYDNLIVNGYLEEEGALTDPDFFLDPDNQDSFEVDVDLADATGLVIDLIDARLARFGNEALYCEPEILAGLRLTEPQLTRLFESLRFNGHLDEDGYYRDQESLESLSAADFALGTEFASVAGALLDILQEQITAFRTELTTFTVEDFAELADRVAAERVAAALDGAYLIGGRVQDEDLFTDPAGALDLGPALPTEEQDLVFARIVQVRDDEAAYRLAPSAILELGFTQVQRDDLLNHLVESGQLTDGLAVVEDRLAYFADAGNSLDFALAGWADYSREVFFLLHDVAAELTSAVSEITELLVGQAEQQETVLYSCLADVLGVPPATATAICQSVAGGPHQARELLAAPALDFDELPADPRLRLGYRRIRRFALLAAKLGLDPTEVHAVFRDQDLGGKFPEPLTLPPGLTRFESLLVSADGTIYLFGDGGYWTYAAATYARTSPERRPLTDLSPRFTSLTGIDAAFVLPTGVEWIIGHDAAGALASFTREPGGTRWAPKAQTWGTVRNNFTDPARIDSAFVDSDGRTYLFTGDQYVRYSGGYDLVDEGYPRSTAEWWEREGLDVPVARTPVDASFQDPDGAVHMFAGDQWLTVDGAGPAAETWGRIRPTFDRIRSLDAAYASPSAVHLLSGREALRYSDSIENTGVLADEGVPRFLHDVPPQFEGGVEAAFTDAGGVVHLFKDGKTVALTGTNPAITPTVERWGRLRPPLYNGRVESAFAGLDGKTYLFCGAHYLRYSTADYSTVDSGYPRAIEEDWRGLSRVDSSFVMDGRTYLFGVGGLLLDLSPEHRADLETLTLTPAIRNVFREHGLTVTGLRGGAPQWTLTTEEGGTLTVRLEGLRYKVRGDGFRFYVRYSTSDYRTPDPGYPKPLSDNWWNMPDGMELGPVDAVFTGRDDRTYLFAGDRFVRFDARHRWWSEPMSLSQHWDSIPFPRIDAAFVGPDGRTYLFSGDQYVRYSTDDYTQVDDRYPAKITSLWGHVANSLARTGKVDAALSLEVPEKVDGVDVRNSYTYLFSGDQYVRYVGDDLTFVQEGYPRQITALATEPGLTALGPTLDGVDAAFADRRTAYLFRDGQCHAVSTALQRRYDDLPLGDVTCAFIEDGSILTAGYYGDWTRRSAFEGRTVTSAAFRPRTLRTVPQQFRARLDSVLTGADGNTYLFQGPSCFNVQLNRAYPLAQEWGRPRNAIYEDNAVDAAFVGSDGRTYLFSDDQFVVYPDAGGTIDGDPLPIAGRWAGLTSVTLAYVRGEQTFLFEKPDKAGQIRYVVYSGSDYLAPDEGYPAFTDKTHLGAPDGFPFPDAVLFEGDTMILLSGQESVSYNERTGRWSIVRPIERLFPGFGRDLDAPDGLRTAFTALDGATYFFFDETYARFADRAFGPLTPVQDRWGLSRNPFVADGGTVDAAFVWRDTYTYLFSGDHYVRYTGPGYRSIDPGYPKKIAVELRKEEPFAGLPESFEDALDRRIDAVIGNDRTIHLIIGGVCHTVSTAPAVSFSLYALGATRNTLADTGKVDAALVADRRTYLFSGDQYVRYSGPDRTYIDDGYPRSLADLSGELGVPQLPEDFQDGLDAAFRGPDGHTYLFRGRRFVSGGPAQPVSSRWGKVGNEFTAGGLDAAFVAPSGELYAFRNGQFVRYAEGSLLDVVEEGFPRTVRDDWGDLPADFETGPDSAFVFEGRTYLRKGDQYVRYSGGYHAVDRTFPQSFTHRWSGTSDYRLSDVHTIVGFIDLCRSRPEGLADFFVTGAADPYQYLADLFGWEIDEVRWARRNSGLLTADTREEHLFEIEFLLELVDLFATTDRLGAGPAELYTTVWSKAFGPAADLAAASTALYGVLERRTAPQQWTALASQLHNELNVATRDALVAALRPTFGTSRELFERFLIDVEMGSTGTTSRVREAIAATQLFLHRYLLDLETVDLPAGVDPDEVKDRLRTWWGWMRNYRIWEANRKVFLYPENYLRPDLRTHKTPAFAALESDLLQGEITAGTVQKAYKRYLEEYTEVSRLAIAGGYVYSADDAEEGVRELVLFGRTRTEPRRYYYRIAQFRDGEKLSATWEPWLKVDVQIDAERVDPVHAFGRVFVFWPVIESVPQADSSRTTIQTTPTTGGQTFTAPPPRYRLKICYSFCNLNGEWVPAQVLAVDAAQTGPITGASLYVQASRTVPGVSVHDAIVVQCSYTAGTTAVTSAFTLTPELYGLRAATGTIPPAHPADLSRIFMEPAATPITTGEVVRFNAPADSVDGPWFSVDHKGGSFLCRPVAAPFEPAQLLPLKGNTDRLPTTWDRIDAACQLPNGTLYFFDNATDKFILVPPGKVTFQQVKQLMTETFGWTNTSVAANSTVDAGLVRGEQILLFGNDEYYRYPKAKIGFLDPGYPKKIAANTENLPAWPRIDVAFTSPAGAEVFYSRTRDGFVVSGALSTLRSAREWLIPAGIGLDGAVVRNGSTFLIFGGQYVRLGADLLPEKGYPRPLAKNTDGVPETGVTGPAFSLGRGSVTFDNAKGLYSVQGGPQPSPFIKDLGRVPTELTRTGHVDAAYVADGRLFLITGTEFVRYTLLADGSVPVWIDAGYPRQLARPIDAVFTRGDQRYAFSGTDYALLAPGQEPDSALTYLPVQGNWRSLPAGFPLDFTGTLETDTALFFFMGTQYASYPAAEAIPRPYEIAALPNEIIRLTSSTAYELNRLLLTGGVDALLDPSTQELDELPAFSGTISNATTIKVRPQLAVASVPVSSHLDFDSSNGLYYWEIFFHAPLLIAQALNNAQRFQDARQWYEYIFDPTQRERYWRFLPFLAVDVDALIAACRQDLTVLHSTVESRLGPILDSLAPLAPAFRQSRELTAAELALLTDLAGTGLDQVRASLAGLPQNATATGLGERVAMIARLRRQYDLMGDRGALLLAYLNDPFDPHAIAELRPEAYRRTVVMAYIDNLLDWGDLLFRQYTAESVDEARMLYIFAYDLLGQRPYALGPRALPAATPYELLAGDGPGETGHLTADGTLLEAAGAVHAGVANPYFYVPGNSLFLEYWTRVEDRLTKIRQSLDIMGIARPLPLFEPPADVMALVRGAATGASLDQLTAAATTPVPLYRFDFVHQRAKELADRLRQLGGDLLGAFERRDTEELNLLQNRQQAEILALTRLIKETQVRIADEALVEVRASRDAAESTVRHYEKMLADGLSALQQEQLTMMTRGATAHYVASGLKIGAAFARGVPQALLGPFIFGTSVGGDQVGSALDVGAEVSSTMAEGFSMTGEVLGVRADQERQEQDWRLQLALSRADVVQLGHQITGAELQAVIARRELEIHNREAEQLDTVTAFLTGKFAGGQLYGWMVGQLSGLYFQTYHLAYEMARSAERAFEYERSGSAGIIQPAYWDSRRNGLLAGDGLALDLDRLGQAYAQSDQRGLEITKRVSLLELDPLALLTFKTDGKGEFALTEALFDRDFPGHYDRRIKTVSVTFETADGPVSVNATLTQLDARTVLEPDPKAVKYLLDPKGSPPEKLRSQWRPGQQIVLSDAEDGQGLFELRFDDVRYLPFEGTGAVSRWRLAARRVPAGVLDVTITVKYSAEQGGETFATTVRGMLKPYPTARYLDVVTEFPEEWSEFMDTDTAELLLPVTPDLLPGLSGRQVGGLYPRYELAERGSVRFLLNGDSRLPLTEGRLLSTPGLSAGSHPWRLVFEGDKSLLKDFALVLSYRSAP
ncbi:MAG: hemopexin repeat-containing protein [Streptosporangiaceae bacterium]